MLPSLLHSHELKDRILWFDGDSSMSADRMAEVLLSGKSIDGIHPLEIDASVKKYNMYTDNHLTLKNDIKPYDFSYTIPEEYQNINLQKYILTKLLEVVKRDEIINKEAIEARISRVMEELKLFKEYNMENLVRTTIYIVDQFDKNSVVWGTGRGSSCACYCFYLIGLHEVDSIFYDLALNEFFR